LDTDEFHRGDAAAVFDAKLDYLSNSFHERVQILGLGMAAGKGRHGGDIIAIFIPLDDDREFSRGFHKLILSWRKVTADLSYTPNS
jgi:hypothetical protein